MSLIFFAGPVFFIRYWSFSKAVFGLWSPIFVVKKSKINLRLALMSSFWSVEPRIRGRIGPSYCIKEPDSSLVISWDGPLEVAPGNLSFKRLRETMTKARQAARPPSFFHEKALLLVLVVGSIISPPEVL